MVDVDQPLDCPTAKRLMRKALDDGVVAFTKHAEEELTEDDLTMVDCVNVLRAGIVEPPEMQNGSWRYRVTTSRICVVVVFRSETKIVVVTAWRRSA